MLLYTRGVVRNEWFFIAYCSFLGRKSSRGICSKHQGKYLPPKECIKIHVYMLWNASVLNLVNLSTLYYWDLLFITEWSRKGLHAKRWNSAWVDQQDHHILGAAAGLCWHGWGHAASTWWMGLSLCYNYHSIYDNLQI